MSNWTTMKHNILRDMSIDTTTSGSVADTDVGRAIVESIIYNRARDLGWNNAEHSFFTDPGVREYPLPNDFLGLTGDVFHSTTPESSVTVYQRRVMKYRPMSWIKANLYRIDSGSEYVDLGIPGVYSIEPATRRMHLNPAPADVARIEFTYLRDPGTPTFKSDGTTWTFYNPNTDDTLSSTFSNEWFQIDKGYNLVMNRAVYILCSRGYGGTEEMANRGATALRLWAEELSRLRGAATKVSGANEVRPWI